MLDYLKNKKILILGFAREGIDTLQFLRKLFPRQIFALADQKELSFFEVGARKLMAKDVGLPVSLLHIRHRLCVPQSAWFCRNIYTVRSWP